MLGSLKSPSKHGSSPMVQFVCFRLFRFRLAGSGAGSVNLHVVERPCCRAHYHRCHHPDGLMIYPFGNVLTCSIEFLYTWGLNVSWYHFNLASWDISSAEVEPTLDAISERAWCDIVLYLVCYTL